MDRPNITISTSAVRMTNWCSTTPSSRPAAVPMTVSAAVSLYTYAATSDS